MNDSPAKPETDPHKPGVPMPKFSSSHTEVLLDRVGRKIVEARNARGMTPAALARASSVPVATIFTIELGTHNTSLLTLAKLAAGRWPQHGPAGPVARRFDACRTARE